MADDRIITALDVHSLDDMKKLVETLGDSVSFIKSGWNSLQCRSRCSTVFEGPGETCFPRSEGPRYSQYGGPEHPRPDPPRCRPHDTARHRRPGYDGSGYRSCPR